MKQLIKAVLSPYLQRRARLRRQGARWRDLLGSDRWCPVCGHGSRRFAAFGDPPRDEAMCLHCGALERHRLFWLYLTRNSDLCDGRRKTMLHIAPEPALERLFRRHTGGGYLSGDLNNPRAMERVDITDIQHPDGRFDIIFCSHVLEHVPEDRKALREFARVLKPDGWALLAVPMRGEATFEDFSVTEPEQRRRVFGQFDHVRWYGEDFADRLREAGLSAERLTAREVVAPNELERVGLRRMSDVFYICRKACGGESA
jgi:hypothetical protein